jgi:hypothetical protein
MTCRIQAKITYNWPIVVEKVQGTAVETLFKSAGEPQTYIGEHTYDLDTGFSGNQVIRVTEQQKA